jgi:hypothetical protein
MHWVLQGGELFSPHEWETLVGTLDRFEIPHSVHRVVPFVGELQPDIDIPDGRAICFGSYAMRHAAAAKKWVPGVYDLAEFTFEEQLIRWGHHLLNHDSQVVAFGAVELSTAMFIRPIDDTKAFAGRVFEPDDFGEWQQKVRSLGDDNNGPLSSSTLVQVVEPRRIYQEVRYWIVDGAIVTRSIYKTGDSVHYDSRVDEHFDAYALEVVNIWKPLAAFVLDICDTPEGLRIVEINTINSAGFYAADIQSVVLALEAINHT